MKKAPKTSKPAKGGKIGSHSENENNSFSFLISFKIVKINCYNLKNLKMVKGEGSIHRSNTEALVVHSEGKDYSLPFNSIKKVEDFTNKQNEAFKRLVMENWLEDSTEKWKQIIDIEKGYIASKSSH